MAATRPPRTSAAAAPSQTPMTRSRRSGPPSSPTQAAPMPASPAARTVQRSGVTSSTATAPRPTNLGSTARSYPTVRRVAEARRIRARHLLLDVGQVVGREVFAEAADDAAAHLVGFRVVRVARLQA